MITMSAASSICTLAPVKYGARVILLLLLAFPGGADGLVLCLSEDGHIKVEFGCEPTACLPPAACGDEEADAGCTREEGACRMDAGRAAACVDIPLSSGAAYEADFRAAPNTPPSPVAKKAAASSADIRPHPAGDSCPRPGETVPPLPPAGLHALRCTVLLI